MVNITCEIRSWKTMIWLLSYLHSSLALSLAHSEEAGATLWATPWRGPPSEKLKVASRWQQQRTEALSPATHKELSPTNSHVSVPRSRSTQTNLVVITTQLCSLLRDPESDPLRQAQASNPQNLPNNKCSLMPLSYGVICYSNRQITHWGFYYKF